LDHLQLAGDIEAGCTVFNSGAGANQAHEINVAALAMISSLMMHLNPERRYGVLTPLPIAP